VFPGGQDIAQVISVNHYPRTYTVLAPGEDYVQCNCPWERGNICKHAVKAYKTVHPDASDTRIIQQRESLRGTVTAGYSTISVDGFRAGEIVHNSGASRSATQLKTFATVDEKAVELIELHTDIQGIVAGYINLLDHAVHQARVTKGNIQDLIASRVDEVEHPFSQSIFRPNEGDHNLKRKKGFLEKQ
jgi:hypothetical protein